MRTDLKKSFVLLAIATLAVVGVGIVTFRDLVHDLFPTASHGIVMLGKRDYPSAFVGENRVELGPKSGYVVTYDRSTNTKGEVRYEGVRLTTTECTSLTEPIADELRNRCALNEVWLKLEPGQRPSDVRLYHYEGPISSSYGKSWRPAGRYLIKVSDAGSWSNEKPVAGFEQIDAPVRRFLPARILSTRHVPSLVVLVAFGALAFALVRARRAAAYADSMSTWTEAKLSSEGMLQDEAGGTIGALASGWKRVAAGVVLVDPGAVKHGSVYRELPVVARRSVAAGSHALWSGATALRLRDAKSLAMIGAVTALLGLAARFLGA